MLVIILFAADSPTAGSEENPGQPPAVESIYTQNPSLPGKSKSSFKPQFHGKPKTPGK
jgi:hypothetical protein